MNTDVILALAAMVAIVGIVAMAFEYEFAATITEWLRLVLKRPRRRVRGARQAPSAEDKTIRG